MTIISAHLVNRGSSFQICWSDSRGRYIRKSAGKDLKQANLMLMKFNEWLFEGKDPWEEWLKYQKRETVSRITLSDFF